MSQRSDEQTAMLNEWVRPLIVECLGTFALIFAGAGAIITTQNASGALIAIALAHGLAIGLFVMAAGHISGGAFNPAVTVGLVIGRKLDPVKGGAYIVVQLLGATVAALLLRLAFDKELWDPVALGTPQIAGVISVSQAFLLETVMTFFLMFVIYGTAVDHRTPKAATGLAIGLTITMDIFLAGAATGAAMNPARSFGPALVSSTWTDEWLYWAAPMLGAALAAGLYAYVLLDRQAEAHPGHAPGTSD